MLQVEAFNKDTYGGVLKLMYKSGDKICNEQCQPNVS